MLALIEETVTVEDPALDFTLPGYDIELKVRYQNGDRQAFAVEELMKLFGNGDEDYTVETLSNQHSARSRPWVQPRKPCYLEPVGDHGRVRRKYKASRHQTKQSDIWKILPSRLSSVSAMCTL
ncbi:hypothetical protein LENED_012487 [Lentinula edodes]|uniref:Uncharacterized protein n=1 Tax=Lentinula edodes TaxID=5353 RepID=A0A1Q3ESR9_LENED|nr:hypothetical protein LENED_012487 [Lentinula edodes]